MNIITYGEYINGMLNTLADYINHLVRYDKKLKEIMLKIASISKTKDIKIYKDLIQYLKGVRKAHQEATELFDELDQIGKWYSDGEEISYYVQIFNEKFMNTELPLYLKMPCDLIDAALEADKKMAEGMPTGGAAEVVEISEEVEAKKNQTQPEQKEQSEQEETATMLEGGIRYCHYTSEAEHNDNEVNTCQELSKENSDFYIENEVAEEDVGYKGDSIEAAAEYKLKAEEEQKKKAEELAKQRAIQQAKQAQQAQQTQQAQQPKQIPQSPSANWIMPVSKGHKITSYHGYRIHPVHKTRKFHDGIDINATMNTPVYAVADGKVSVSGWVQGYGKYIQLEHNNGISTFYAHLSIIYVTNKQIVKQGQKIGLSGNTGVGTGAHLHFGVHKGKDSVNPLNYLPKF